MLAVQYKKPLGQLLASGAFVASSEQIAESRLAVVPGPAWTKCLAVTPFAGDDQGLKACLLYIVKSTKPLDALHVNLKTRHKHLQ